MTHPDLHGQVDVVTGASRGIGRAIALSLAAHSAKVALAARQEQPLRTVAEEIAAAGGSALSIPTDMAEEPAIRALVQRTVAEWGRIDIVVNCAGIGIYGPLETTSTADWERLMAVNARGPFILCRETLPYLKQAGAGHIINVASVVGVKGYVNQAAYSASKHALLGMTKVLAQEAQAYGIRVHALCPGGVDTDMAAQARPDLDRSILMSPQEMADIVLFLLGQRGNAVIDLICVRRATAAPWFD